MKGQVLIVDDAAMIRSYMRQVLGEQGYGVTEAVNGCEGLEKALAGTFELIISDVNMPILDGYSMVSSLRKEKSTMAIPIAMVSTEAHEKDSRKAYASGANCYLVKPVRPEELKSMVALLLGDSK